MPERRNVDVAAWFANAIGTCNIFSMDRTPDAVEIAGAFLTGRLSPLQAASKLSRMDLPSQPCCAGTGGANGPLSAIYAAAEAADKCHFLGDDVERWHPHVREQKRFELTAVDAHWRGPIDHACRSLIEYAVTH